jgi:methionine-rich copper-binding protein CopC
MLDAFIVFLLAATVILVAALVADTAMAHLALKKRNPGSERR